MCDSLRPKYYWPGMDNDIKSFLDGCAICYRNTSPNHKLNNPLKLFPAKRVFETLHIDLIGPFQPTEDGYRYVLTMCDRLSRYLEMAPLKTMRAIDVVRAMVNTWICQFGIPENIISDQGSQFESDVFQTLCEAFKIRKKRTTAYRPQANGAIERMHREIKKHLRSIALQYDLHFSQVREENEFVDNWTTYLPIIKFRLNSTRSPATGYTPLEMILGFQPRLPEDLAWSYKPKQGSVGASPKAYLQWLQNCKNTILNDALDHQKLYDRQKKRTFDKRITHQPDFKIGDSVTYKIWTSTKVDAPRSVPYKIIKFNSPEVAVIQNEDTGHQYTVNTSNLQYAQPRLSSRNKGRRRKTKLKGIIRRTPSRRAKLFHVNFDLQSNQTFVYEAGYPFTTQFLRKRDAGIPCNYAHKTKYNKQSIRPHRRGQISLPNLDYDPTNTSTLTNTMYG